MATPEEIWTQMYGQKPKPVGPAANAEDTWLEMYGKRPQGQPQPQQAVAAAPPSVPVPASTPMEQRAIEAAGKGKKLWHVNEPYAGGMDPARAHYNDLLAQGANPKEALFLTAAAAAESNFDSKAIHDKGTGYGLYGHRLDRLDAMRKFTGEQFPGMSAQNAFALHEFRSRPEYKQAMDAQNARDLAIAQMHFERPQGYTPQDPTAGLNFAGRLNTLNKFASLTGEKPVVERGEIAPDWNALKSVGSGAMLGFGPQAEAAFATLRHGRQNYGQYLADIKRQQQYYKEQNPLIGYGAEAAGSMMPVGMGLRVAAPILRMGGAALEGAVPGIGRFLAGEAGQAVPLGEEALGGVAGHALRAASAGAQGAGQAIGQTALEQGSQALGGTLGDTETPFARQYAQNALMGGVLGAGLSRAFQPAKAFEPEWEAGARDIGREAFNRFGLDVYPGQFAKGEAKQFFEETVPQSTLNKQVKEFSGKAAEQIGEKELSPKAIAAAEAKIGPRYDALAAGIGPMRMTPGAARKLTDVYNKSFQLRDPAIQRTVQELVEKVVRDVQGGRLNGTVFRNYTQSGGPIDTKLLGLDNALKKTFGGEIKDALNTLLEHNDPAAFRMLQRMNSHYRDIQTLKKVAQDSGVANPQAMEKVVGKRGSATALKELSDVGQFMPKVNAQGEAVVSGAKHQPESLRHKLSKIGMYGAGGYLATEIPFVSAMMEAGGPLTKYAVPIAAAALGTAGAGAIRRANQARVMRNPQVRQQVFEETYGRNQRAKGRQLVRPLMHGSVEYNPLFGEQQ